MKKDPREASAEELRAMSPGEYRLWQVACEIADWSPDAELLNNQILWMPQYGEVERHLQRIFAELGLNTKVICDSFEDYTENAVAKFIRDNNITAAVLHLDGGKFYDRVVTKFHQTGLPILVFHKINFLNEQQRMTYEMWKKIGVPLEPHDTHNCQAEVMIGLIIDALKQYQKR